MKYMSQLLTTSDRIVGLTLTAERICALLRLFRNSIHWHGTVLPRPFLQVPRTDPLHNVLRGMRSASGGVRRAQRGVTRDSGTNTSISPSVWRPASYTEHRVSSQHAASNTAVDCGAERGEEVGEPRIHPRFPAALSGLEPLRGGGA